MQSMHSLCFSRICCLSIHFALSFIAVDLTSFAEDTGRNQFPKCLWRLPALTPVSGLVSP